MAKKILSANQKLLMLGGIFLFAYFVPFDSPRVSTAISEAFLMLSEYAREHVLLCLVPAFFIAGSIMVFLNQQAVIKYLGPNSNKLVAYSVASISGTILAVCSCTVLPIFKGIYKKGAGIGPAISFLYSGPAINILAIILTAKVLGWQIGIARALGAVLFAFVIGFLMHLIFKREDEARHANGAMFQYMGENEGRSLGQNALYMLSMIGILVFINWAPSGGSSIMWDIIFANKYYISVVFFIALLVMLYKWFSKAEISDWVSASRDFAIQILPLLFAGVMVAGFLLGRPGHQAMIPYTWVSNLLGGNSIGANFIASIAGAFMYFATLTEIPIMQGLLGSGMGQGPALALLLAGPSLSLPSMLVINGELGPKKTGVYVLLVIVMSTLVGMLYGSLMT